MRKQIFSLTGIALLLATLALTACGPGPTQGEVAMRQWMNLCGFSVPRNSSERVLLQPAAEQCLNKYQAELAAASTAVTTAAASKELQTNPDAREALVQARKLRNISLNQTNTVLRLKQKFFEPLSPNPAPQEN